MTGKRELPARFNPGIRPLYTPKHKQLLERRRTAEDCTRTYVTLDVPLPQAIRISGSEMFPIDGQQKLCELRCRLPDLSVEVTSMFRAVFPWASRASFHQERSHVLSLRCAQYEDDGTSWVPETAGKRTLPLCLVVVPSLRPLDERRAGFGKNERRASVALATRFHAAGELRPRALCSHLPAHLSSPSPFSPTRRPSLSFSPSISISSLPLLVLLIIFILLLAGADFLALALELATRYGIRAWVLALLDPTPVAQFHFTPNQIPSPFSSTMAKSAANSPELASSTSKASRKQRTASHEARSASPVKMAQPTPSRPKASPKKRSKKEKTNGVKAGDEAQAASKALKGVLGVDASPSIADSEDDAAAIVANAAARGLADSVAVVNGAAEGEEELKENTARVTVTSDVMDEGEAETTRTSVKVELPAGSPEQPLPESPEQAIQQAKDLVEAAKELSENQGSPQASKKRKAEAMEIENPEEELIEEIVEDKVATVNGDTAVEFGGRTEEPPAKRARVMVPAEEFRRKKMQTRALVGLSATVAVGAIIPFISNMF